MNVSERVEWGGEEGEGKKKQEYIDKKSGTDKRNNVENGRQTDRQRDK